MSISSRELIQSRKLFHIQEARIRSVSLIYYIGKNIEELKEGQKCRNGNYGIRKNGLDN